METNREIILTREVYDYNGEMPKDLVFRAILAQMVERSSFSKRYIAQILRQEADNLDYQED